MPQLRDPGVRHSETNGPPTLSKDPADNGGLRLAHLAIQDKMQQPGRLPDESTAPMGASAEVLFIVRAQHRPELMPTAVKTNPHSILKYRVNNAQGDRLEFEQAFSCKKAMR